MKFRAYYFVADDGYDAVAVTTSLERALRWMDMAGLRLRSRTPRHIAPMGTLKRP